MNKVYLITGQAKEYFYQKNEKEATELIDEFLKRYPNNVSAIITKSKIYSNREEPDYETAINIIEGQK